MARISLDLKKIKEMLELKDMEIGVLKTEVTTAYSGNDQLQQKYVL